MDMKKVVMTEKQLVEQLVVPWVWKWVDYLDFLTVVQSGYWMGTLPIH
jgi:hypothetical protein